MSVSNEVLEILEKTAVATISTVLRQKGFNRVALHGPRPLTEGQKRIAGPAYTMRFVPAREDITTAMAVSGAIQNLRRSAGVARYTTATMMPRSGRVSTRRPARTPKAKRRP